MPPQTNTPSSSHENNKRVAKNALFLYFRSILILCVGLYTSREVLAQLGVSDFGVYNVVGGVIVLFSFIQNAMNSATSRFFTFDLGRENFEKLEQTFSLSIIIHLTTACLIFLLGETVGLWFLNSQLNIPAERMEAANFVYQFTIFSACVGILQMPFMVAINAHERMKAYAYSSIADAIFKLTIVLSLSFFPYDKLKFYSVLLFAVYVAMFFFYVFYCRKHFPETHFKFYWNKEVFLDRIKFSSFEFLGGVSGVMAVQAGIILINRFYGVLMNAANGVAAQVQGAANQFTANFFVAIAPQITKAFARNDLEYFYRLIIRASKFCFLLYFLFMYPLCLQIDFVLNFWLKSVPEWAGKFIILGSVNILICFVFMGVWHGIIATGKNKRFRITDSCIVIMIFPLTFIGLHYSPLGYVCSHIAINIVRVCYALFALRYLTKFPIRSFLKQSLTKCLFVALISFPLPLWVSRNTDGWQGFFLTLISFFAVYIFAALFIGLAKNERMRVIEIAQKKFKRLWAQVK